MRSFYNFLLTGTLILALGLILNSQESNAQVQDNQNQSRDNTVVDVVNSNEDNSHFAELLEKTEMTGILSQAGPFTVLLPSDDALESMDTDIEELKQDPQKAQNLVSGHLYQGNLASEEVESALDVNIVEGDAKASNGVVHVIDEVVRR